MGGRSFGNQHASTLWVFFVTLSREIEPYLVLLIRRTDVNPEVLAAEPSSPVLAGSGYAGREGCYHPGPVRMPQCAHLGMFMPSCEAVCIRVTSLSGSWSQDIARWLRFHLPLCCGSSSSQEGPPPSHTCCHSSACQGAMEDEVSHGSRPVSLDPWGSSTNPFTGPHIRYFAHHDS